MTLPVAIVTAVLVWSSARYLPPYYLEIRKIELEQQKMEFESAKQVAMIRELRAHFPVPKANTAEDIPQADRFY